MNSFKELEDFFGEPAVSKLSCLITCSEYGLTETELLELLMPTSNSEAVICIEDANFNFSSFCCAMRKFRESFLLSGFPSFDKNFLFVPFFLQNR